MILVDVLLFKDPDPGFFQDPYPGGQKVPDPLAIQYILTFRL